MARKRRPQGSGSVRQLTSRRWQARYRDGDQLKSAPVTFDTRLDAEAWLADYADGVAVAPVKRDDPTLRAYSEGWLAGRDLKPRTRSLYQDLLEGLVLPELGGLRLSRITPTRVRAWHVALGSGQPTQRAHAYSLLRTIMGTAVADDLLNANPCRIRGAGTARKIVESRPATLTELQAITDHVPERYRAMILLAAWCGLRFGELTELRRSDMDIDLGVLRIRRAVVRVNGEVIVGDPKSAAGRRDVAIPPHVRPDLQLHLRRHVGPDPDALLFPARGGGHMAPSALYRVFYPAREAAGRPDLRWHDLRHTGATLAASTGATLAELMARLGHSTVEAAMRYQHAASERDQAIASSLSDLATGKVIPLVHRRPSRAG